MDVLLDSIDRGQVMESVRQACAQHHSLQIVTVNTDFLRLARLDPAFREVINNAELAVCDGKLLYWALKLAGSGVPEQITGHDLVHDCATFAAEEGLGVLLLGAAPGVAERAASQLRSLYPGLHATGYCGGRFTNEGKAHEPEQLARRLESLAPSFVFVGLGCPKQDHWIAQNLAQLQVPVGVGVGSVLDVLAGDLPRAPRWMQRAGLESLFQLLAAPRRYFCRYVVHDPPTLARVLLSAWRQGPDT